MWAGKQKAVEAKQEAVQALCARDLAVFKELDSQWYQNDQQYKVLSNSLPPSLLPPASVPCPSLPAPCMQRRLAWCMWEHALGGAAKAADAEGEQQRSLQETALTARALG